MMGSVILWLVVSGYQENFVVQDRFTSINSCEAFVYEFSRKKGIDVRSYICYKDE